MLKTRIIRQKVTMPAKPLEVYEAYIDAEKHSEFTGAEATSDPKVGGEFTAWDGYISGRFLVIDPGRMIVQEWRSSDFPEDASVSRLKLTFKSVENGTQIMLVHSSVPEEIADDIEQGWRSFYWEPMEKFFKRS